MKAKVARPRTINIRCYIRKRHLNGKPLVKLLSSGNDKEIVISDVYYAQNQRLRDFVMFVATNENTPDDVFEKEGTSFIGLHGTLLRESDDMLIFSANDIDYRVIVH